jgi:hypothetical protein
VEWEASFLIKTDVMTEYILPYTEFLPSCPKAGKKDHKAYSFGRCTDRRL